MARREKYTSHCVDCGVEIYRRAIRCSSCAAKARWASGAYDGSFDNEEHRQKQSKNMRAQWERGDYDGVFDNEECRRRKSESLKTAHARGAYDGEECRRKQSEARRAAWKRGDLGSKEHRRKMGEASKAMWESEGYRQRMSEIRKVMWARGDYDGVFRSPTSIELQVIAALDIMGIEHKSQYRPDGYSRIYDEFIPPNILLEIHGDYFHSEEHFPGICKRDTEKAQWAKENGYDLITIWQHEIEKYGVWAIVAKKVRSAK